ALRHDGAVAVRLIAQRHARVPARTVAELHLALVELVLLLIGDARDAVRVGDVASARAVDRVADLALAALRGDGASDRRLLGVAGDGAAELAARRAVERVPVAVVADLRARAGLAERRVVAEGAGHTTLEVEREADARLALHAVDVDREVVGVRAAG